MTDFDRVRQAPADPDGGGHTPTVEDHDGYSITPIMGTVAGPPDQGRETEFPGIDLRGSRVRPASKNPYLIYLAQLGSTESRRSMARCLDRIADLYTAPSGTRLPDPAGQHFPWELVGYEHTAAIRSLILEQTDDNDDPWSPTYCNKHLSALRQVLRHAWRLGLMTAEQYMRAREIENVKGVRLPPGRHLAPAERDALTNACLADGSPVGLRDAAVLEALFSTGCRRAEIAAMTREAYDVGSRTVRVIGKGNKEREVYLTERAAEHIGRWLVTAPKGARPLFSASDRWGNLLAEHLLPDSIGKIVARRAKQAGIPDVSPHDFRRTFCSDLLDLGVDMATVQALLGHASPTTTAGYDRRPARKRRAAVDRLTYADDAQGSPAVPVSGTPAIRRQ